MSGAVDMSGRKSRIDCYFVLAECFKEPEQSFVEQVIDGTLSQTIVRAFEACGLGGDAAVPTAWLTSDDPGDSVERFTDAYYQLFKGPFPPYVVPVESVYRTWAATPLASESGRARDMIMGDPAVEMLKRYKADGIEIPDAYKPYPDHVALLLEYGGLLLERGEPGVHAEFVRRHLSWMTELRRDIFETSDNSFYRWVADALCRFAGYELSLADGGIDSGTPGNPPAEPAPERAAIVFDN